MAGRIQGITVEIGGDTTKLQGGIPVLEYLPWWKSDRAKVRRRAGAG